MIGRDVKHIKHVRLTVRWWESWAVIAVLLLIGVALSTSAGTWIGAAAAISDTTPRERIIAPPEDGREQRKAAARARAEKYEACAVACFEGCGK